MSRQRITPEVAYLSDGGAAFRVPYDAGWVAGIKALVPGHAREWDPAARIWIVDAPYIEAVVSLTRRTFGYVDGASDVQKPHHAAQDNPHVVLHLLPSAPPQLIDAVYRTLAKLAHPDRGGTHEQMVALTAAHDALTARMAS